MTTRIGMIGGRGYAGEEFIALFKNVPEYELVFVGSAGKAGQPVPNLDLSFSDLSDASIRQCDTDAWIIAQGNGRAHAFVPLLGDARVVDISADYRFDDTWTYGLPDANRDSIRSANRVSNPGCYATATQLALLPIAKRLVGQPVAFGVSGYSGAGRTPSDRNDPKRLADNILAYALTGHVHQREVSRQLGRPIQFMPHVASFFRGIHLTVSFQLDAATTAEQICGEYEAAYTRSPLVSVVKDVPEIQHVVGTNRAVVGGFTVDPQDASRVCVVAVIDNLRKGCASQAIENLNLMFGFEAEMGLL